MLSNQDSEDRKIVTFRVVHITQSLFKHVVALRTEEDCLHIFFGGFLHWGKSVSKLLWISSFVPNRFGYIRQDSTKCMVTFVSGKQAGKTCVQLLQG